MQNPDISVVIPTLGRTSVLEICLEALTKQTFDNFEVVAVTNNVDGLRYISDRYPKLKISFLKQEKKGLAQARNTGLSYSRGRIISFIDDDTIPYPDWTKEIHNTFNESLDVGGVSGPTFIPQELIAKRDILRFHNRENENIFWKIVRRIYTSFVLEDKASSVGRIFRSGAFSLGSNYKEATEEMSSCVEVDYLEACNMSFRKDILDRIGGFSPEYKGIGDWSEPDLAFRVRRENYKLLFNPKAALIHQISQEGVYVDRGKDSYQRMKNFTHFYFKWIKPNTLDKILRFGTNLFFLNAYWFYKFIETHNFSWLRGISGTFSGLKEGLQKKGENG